MSDPTYATLDQLKGALNIPLDTVDRDPGLMGALDATSRGIERATGRRFWLDPAPVQRVYRLPGRILSDDAGQHLLVDDIGDSTGMVVETGTTGAWTALTGYETGPENALADRRSITSLLRSTGVWGYGPSARVRVTARFGWPAVPSDVNQACLLQAARLYRRKDSPEGVTGSAEWGVVRLSRRDPDVWLLLEPFMLPGFG